MTEQEWTPGELAPRAGVAISALHFYEREGLISSRRTGGNQRSCALSNPGDVLGNRGPGAVRL